MRMKIVAFFIIFHLCAIASGFDVIRTLFKYVDFNLDPCDNFYEHVCSRYTDQDFAIVTEYTETMEKLKAKQNSSVWKNLEIEDLIERTNFEKKQVKTIISNLLYKRCEEGLDNEQLLEMVEESIFGRTQEDFCGSTCILFLAADKNCSRAAEVLEHRLQEKNVALTAIVKALKKQLDILRTNINGTSSIIAGGLDAGVNMVDDIISKIASKVTDWIQDTPWVMNNQLVEPITAIVNEVHLYKNYESAFHDNWNELLSLNDDYIDCLEKLGEDHPVSYFCLIHAAGLFNPMVKEKYFFNEFNAYNGNPVIMVSLYEYHMAQYVQEYAAVLGSVGNVLGHEVGHTLIEDANNLEILEYFSNNSMHCIQNQFQKTCDAFNDKTCNVLDTQLDDNGSDILGFQLVYSIFEEIFKNRLEEVYIEIGDRSITMRELFFYSFSFSFCKENPKEPNEEHSAGETRVNVVAQHPAFQETFQCAPNSRMMESTTEQCIVFGKGAPETRK